MDWFTYVKDKLGSGFAVKALRQEVTVGAAQPEGDLAIHVQHRDRLNLGCGRKYLSEALNLDFNPETNADVVHDLNQLPWPLPDNCFREVLAYDVIEHLDNFIAVMEEIHRVCQDGALVRITVPHFSGPEAYTDPTHRRYFGYLSFDYVTGEHEIEFYTRVRFKTLTRNMIFFPSLVNKLVWRLANRFPAAYERRWTWIFPAWYLYFELEVQKGANDNGQRSNVRKPSA
jgi:SAM-dependent methyltransferase